MGYRSSAESFAEFMKGSIWADMKEEIDLWIEDIHEDLEDPSGLATEKELNRLGGNVEAMRKLKMMPEMIMHNILEDTKRKQEENEENEG